MWRLLLVTLLYATATEARTIRGVLADAQELVGIRPSPALTAFADHFVTLAGELAGGPNMTAAGAAAGGATIDATMSLLGPVFLDHAATVGAGRAHVMLLGQATLGDATLHGQPLENLGAGLDGLTVLARTPTGNPASPAATGVRLRYELDLHVWSAAFAATYGVTDALDVSVVLPVVATRLDCAVSAVVLRTTSSAGGFERVPASRRSGRARPVESTGLGDVVLRMKHALPAPAPLELALSLEAQFPTGDPDQVHGTGAYWLTPAVDLMLPVWSGRAMLAASGSLAFNVSTSTRSQAGYGASASVVLWPGRLAGIVEFLGRSQLDEAFTPHDTDVLTFVDGGFDPAPVLGVDWGRRVDVFDFAFGVRVKLTPTLAAFAAGSVPLNPDVALRPVGVTPTVGIGGRF